MTNQACEDLAVSGLYRRSLGRLGSALSDLGARLKSRSEVGNLVNGTGTPRGPNASGVYIDESNVLTIPSAWAAVSAPAEDVASLPLRLKRRLSNGASEVVTDHPAARLFARSPDGGQTTPQQLLKAWIMHRLVCGNGFLRADWRNGWPVRLRVLHPDEVSVFYRDDPEDLDSGVDYSWLGKPLAREQVLHLAGVGEDGISGHSPTILGQQTLGLGKAAESHAASFMGNASIPSGIVTPPPQGSPEKNEALVKKLESKFSGENKYRLYIAPPGTTWTQTSVNPADAQVLEARAFQVLEASRLWRVPPDKLGDLTKASYATVEQSNLSYLGQTLRPICESIEAVLDLRLLTDREVEQGYFWEFDFTAYLRADTATRSAWLRNMTASGLIKIDEGRAIEGLPPLPDGLGDKLMVPLNTSPVDLLVQQIKEQLAQ